MRQRTYKDAIELNFCATHCFARSLPLTVVCFPTKTPLEKTQFSFVSGYWLVIASGLGMGAFAQFLKAWYCFLNVSHVLWTILKTFVCMVSYLGRDLFFLSLKCSVYRVQMFESVQTQITGRSKGWSWSWGDDSVGNVLDIPSWGPDFGSLTPK